MPPTPQAQAAPPRTAADYLRLAQPYLARHGSSTPRLDAEVLLAHVLGTSRLDLYTRLDQPLSRHEVDAYRQAIVRRANREPVAYIVGYKEFFGLRLRVGPGVLVPRPETEFLVELALRVAHRSERALWFVDVGTGSGALAITLAARRPHLAGVGSDISPEVLGYARANARDHGVGDRVAWVQGDGLSWAAGGAFDLVVSNPPYVPAAEIEHLAPEIRRYEPRAALDGGPDGLVTARRVAKEAARVLRPGGILLMELGTSRQAEQLAAECRRWPDAFEKVAALRDEVTRVPVLAARTPGEQPLAWPATPAEEGGTGAREGERGPR
ncbi:MAG: peptide chain release factor N(5)-glutamine methyltransferase [Bacillota bacterium]